MLNTYLLVLTIPACVIANVTGRIDQPPEVQTFYRDPRRTSRLSVAVPPYPNPQSSPESFGDSALNDRFTRAIFPGGSNH